MTTETTDGDIIAGVVIAGFRRGGAILQHRIEAGSQVLEQTQNALHTDYAVKAVRDMILTVLDLRLLADACDRQVRAAATLLADPATHQRVTEAVAFVMQQTEGTIVRILPSWIATVREGWPQVYHCATEGVPLPAFLKATAGRKAFLGLLLSSTALPGGLLPPEK